MFKIKNCPQCNSLDQKTLYSIKLNLASPGWKKLLQHNGLETSTLNIDHCQNCGLSFRRERFTNEELMVMYGSTDAPNQRQPDYPRFWQRSQEIFTHTTRHATVPWGRARLLDFGGGQGELSHWFAQHHGCHCDVLDFGAAPGALASGMQRIGALPTANAAPVEHYDFIMLNHVLEHVNNPTETLAQLHSVCHPNTVLYVEVPYELLHYHVLHTQGHYEHINYFGVSSVHNLIVLAGFVPLSVELRLGFGNSIPVVAAVFQPAANAQPLPALRRFSAWREVYHPKIIALWLWAKLKLRFRWQDPSHQMRS